MSRPCTVLLALSLLTVSGCWHTKKPLTHFKCYVAEGEPPEHEALMLRDQFHVEENVRLVKLRYFCNPVTKYVRGQPRKAALDEDHLTCYLLKPQDRFPASVAARNQFGDTELKTRKSELLCVPTRKHGFERLPTPPPSHCPGKQGCCCNMPDGQGGTWPGCAPGFECRRQANPAQPNRAIQVCVPNGTPPGAPLQLHPSQPAFCRI